MLSPFENSPIAWLLGLLQATVEASFRLQNAALYVAALLSLGRGQLGADSWIL